MARSNGGNLVRTTVRDVYQKYKALGGEFNVSQVDDDALAILQAQNFVDDLLADMVRTAVREIDDNEARDETIDSRQAALPGFHLNRVYRLGEGRRIPERSASILHAQEHLAILRKHAQEALSASDREADEYGRLAPYWTPDRTKSMAVEAYWAANP